MVHEERILMLLFHKSKITLIWVYIINKNTKKKELLILLCNQFN